MRILAGATTVLRRIVDLGLVILIVVVLLGVILGKGAPLVGRQSIVIGGGSMEPTIGLGAVIVVRPVAPASLAVDDVVSMQVGPDRATYTHRIVALVDRPDGRWIRTKGDANAAPDPTLVPASAVIGRVEFVIPLAGYLLALLSLPMGIMFVLGLAATLLAMAWLLESLEPEPRPVRRPAGADAIDPLPEPTSAGLPAAASVLDPELLDGEPIAARPVRIADSSLGGATWAFAAPALAPAISGSLARPTVRAQIERSREVRQRRARWLIGRGHSRSAAD
ncbi:MAG TPA: signal peptidase I [Candidatus Limnocylindrales bacterium]|nr:signal peptidase I [Candidatus Limnocylindrales bacterium]